MALIKCPECGKEISDKAAFCPECGYPIANHLKTEAMHNEATKCPSCGYENEPEATYCQKCSMRLSEHAGSKDFPRNSNNGSKINIGRSKDVVPEATKSESSNGTIGFILSIIALLLVCAPSYIGVFVGIAAIVACIPGTKKNKGLAVAGVIISSFAIVLCLLFSAIRDDRDNVSNSTTREPIEKDRDSTKTNDIGTGLESTTIDEQIIYNNNNVIIKVMGCQESHGSLYVNMYIENNSVLNLGFNAHSYGVNGIMTRNNIYDMDCDVAAGKKANTRFLIKKEFIDQYNIATVSYIDILFWAYNNDTMFKAFETEQIKISTNHDTDLYYDIQGKKLYDGKNIEVEYIGQYENSFSFCLKNLTGGYFDFDVSNISINDYTVSETDLDLRNEQVLNGCQIIFSINVSDDFIKTNGIDTIDKMEFNFDIRPLGDYSDEWSTDIILFETKQN